MSDMNTQDWFGLVYDNQSATAKDFLRNGIDSSQVSLKSKDYYKNQESVQEAFKGEDGKFDENAFNDFYKNASIAYNSLSNTTFEESQLPDIEYDIMSTLSKPGDKRQDITLDIINLKNPFLATKGLKGIYGTTYIDMSNRELAQSQKIWDSKNEQWLDETPEDKGFWGTTFGTPLALAQYDEETITTDENGRRIKHEKGELKLNEDGLPYYETIENNRSTRGRQVLTSWDVLTREDSVWNKYDFMDNDGLDKSITGTVMQTVASIAPLFIPGVGTAYTYALTARELAKLTATLGKMVDGIFNPNATDADYPWLNALENHASKFSTSVSDASQKDIFTLENFGKLASDVATQLFQQRALAEIPRKLGLASPQQAALKSIRNTYGDDVAKQVFDGDIIKNESVYNALVYSNPEIRDAVTKAVTRNNLYGKTLSTLYMAGTSTMDVFNDALDAGYDRRTAAFTAALAMGATFGMMNKYEIGQVALQGMGFNEERHALKAAVNGFLKEAKEELSDVVTNKKLSLKTFKGLMGKLNDIYDKAGRTIAKGGYIGSALGEGIEEVTEEAIMDVSKEITDAINYMFDVNPDAEFKFTESNPYERYLMSAIGGAIGGAIFRGLNRTSDINKNIPNDTKEHLMYLLRNGKKQDVIKELERLRKRGVASKTLSTRISDYDASNNPIFEQALDNKDSQNDALVDLAEQTIEEWDAIINQEGLNINDDDLFTRSTLQDKRIKDLINFSGKYDLFQDFNSKAVKIAEKAIRRKDIERELSEDSSNNTTALQTELSTINADIATLKAEKDELLSGAKTQEYIEKSLFNLSDISNPFYARDIYTYTRQVFKKNYNQLSEGEKEEINDRYELYKNDEKSKFNDAFIAFKNMASATQSDILRAASIYPELDAIKTYLNEEERQKLLELDKDALDQYAATRDSGEMQKHAFELILNPSPNIDEDIAEVLVDYFTANYEGAYTTNRRAHNEAINNIKVWLREAASNGINSFTAQNLKDGIDTVLADDDIKLKGLKELIAASTDVENDNAIKNLELNYLEKLHNNIIEYQKSKRIFEIIEATKNDGIKITKDTFKLLEKYLGTDLRYSYNEDIVKDRLEGPSDNLYYEYPEDVDTEAALFYEISEGERPVIAQNEDGSYIIKEDVKKAFKEATDIYDLVARLDAITNSPKDTWKLLNRFIPDISPNIKSISAVLLDNIRKLSEIRNNVVNNPLIDILDKIDIDVEGASTPIKIFTLLANESAALNSLSTISEYVLQDRIKVSQLENASNSIDMIISVLQSMRDTREANVLYGYNQVINEFNQNNPKLGIKDNPNYNTILGTVNPNIVNAMLDDLNMLKKQLEFFINLSLKNKGDKLVEHISTCISTQKALLKVFTDKKFTERTPELFDDSFKAVINKYIGDFDKLQNLAPGNKEGFVLLNKVIFDIENKLFEIAKEKKLNKAEIIEKLFGAYDYNKDLNLNTYHIPDALNSKTSELPKDILYTYFHTILTIKAADVENALVSVNKDELESGNTKPFIPIFSQKFAARIALAYIRDPKLMCHIIDPEGKNPDTYKGKKILQTKLFNLLYVNGAPGVGKSQGVAKLVRKLAKKLGYDFNYIVVGPGKSQAINIYNGLLDTDYDKVNTPLETVAKNDTQNKITVVDDLIKNILNPEYSYLAEDIKKASYDEENSDIKTKNVVVINEQFKTLNPKLFTETKSFLGGSSDQLFNTTAFNDQKVLVIDEVTFASRAQLELLSRWALATGKIIIGLGDLTQDGYLDKKGYEYTLDNACNYVYTPTLDNSLRVTNIHQKDANDVLRVIAESSFKIVSSYNGIDKSTYLLDMYKSAPILKYYQDDNILNGIKITETLDSSDISLLTKSSEPIIYIYDDANSESYIKAKTFAAANPGKIIFQKLAEVQGNEAQYCIIDLHLDYDNSGANNIESITKKIYTAITRAKDGSIIVNNNFTKWYTKGSEKIDYTADAVISNKAAKDFTELSLETSIKILEGAVLEGNDASTNTNDANKKGTTVKAPEKEADIMTKVFENNTEGLNKIDNKDRTPIGDEVGSKDGFTFYSYANRIGIKLKNKNSNEYYIGHTTSPVNKAPFSYIPENTDVRILLDKSISTTIKEEDLQEVKDKIALINNIKSILINKIDINNRNSALKELDVNFKAYLRSANKPSIESLSEGKFKLKFKEVTYGKGSPLKNYNEIALVFSVPYNANDDSEGFYDIEICSGPNPDKDTSKLSEEQKSYYSAYKNFFNTVKNNYDKNKNPYVELRDDFTVDRISNSIIWKDSKTFVTLEEVNDLYPGIRFSKPYIFTKDNTKEGIAMQNMESRASKETSKLKSSYLKGKAVVFVTHDTNLFDYDTDTPVSEEGYMSYYVNQLNGEYDSNPEMRDKVRMLVLNPIGIQFKDFLEKYSYHIENSSTSNIRFYKSFMGDYTGHDILFSLINYQKYLSTKATTDGITETQSKKLNLLNTLIKTIKGFTYEENEFTDADKEPLEKHIARVLKRITESFDSLDEGRRQFRGITDNYNGADVMYYIYLINKRIQLGKDEGLEPMLKGTSIMPSFTGMGIDSDFFINTINEALTGKIGNSTIDKYNAIFPEGIFPFPVYDENKSDSRAGNMAYEALDLGNMYYIDRDIQPPKIYVSLSRDLANPEVYDIKKSEVPKHKPTTTSDVSTFVESSDKGSDNTNINTLPSDWRTEDSFNEYNQEVITAIDYFIKNSIEPPADFMERADIIYKQALSLSDAMDKLKKLKEIIQKIYGDDNISQDNDLSVPPSEDGTFNPSIESESNGAPTEEVVLTENESNNVDKNFTPEQIIQKYKELATDKIWDMIENILSLKELNDDAKVIAINNLDLKEYTFEYFIKRFKEVYPSIHKQLSPIIKDTEEGLDALIVSMWQTAYKNPAGIIEDIKDMITEGSTIDVIKKFSQIYSSMIKFYSAFEINC